MGRNSKKYLEFWARENHDRPIIPVSAQGSPGAGTRNWLPVLRKIQAAGKCAQIQVAPEDLEFMLDNLGPEGIMYTVPAKTEYDVREIMRFAERGHR